MKFFIFFNILIFTISLEIQAISVVNKKTKETNTKHFKPKATILMEAVFYSKEETHNGLPATGLRGSTLAESLAGYGPVQVSVDPRVIPLHSTFRMKLWDGRIVTCKALDTGASIKGKIVDIYVNSIREAINLGRRKVLVFL